MTDDGQSSTTNETGFRGSDDGPSTPCSHAPAVGYVVGFAVRDAVGPVDAVDSGCDMRATVHEAGLTDADAVGCAVSDCECFHERVAEQLRRDAARHSGNVRDQSPDGER